MTKWEQDAQRRTKNVTISHFSIFINAAGGSLHGYSGPNFADVENDNNGLMKATNTMF